MRPDPYVTPAILRALDRERLALPSMPSGTAIRHADLAMWRSERGLCPECAAPVNEEGDCDVCREEGQRCECDPPEEAR